MSPVMFGKTYVKYDLSVSISQEYFPLLLFSIERETAKRLDSCCNVTQ
jgi:hypothetical protein